MPQHLYLTGYRGTGKTSVGVVLAKSLGTDAIDLDQVIETGAEKSIREIFDLGGEPLFRKLETEALKQVAGGPRAVVSLGGGAILSEANRGVIRRSGTCFWLDADAETIAERIAQDGTTADRRPPLTSLGQLEEIRQLLGQRRNLYQAAADHRIETAGKSVDGVASEILSLFAT